MGERWRGATYKLLMKQLSSNHSHVYCYAVVSTHQMFVFVVVPGDNVQQDFTELGHYSCGRLLYNVCVCVCVCVCMCVYSGLYLILVVVPVCFASCCLHTSNCMCMCMHTYVCVFCNRWGGMFCKHLQAGTDVGVNEECGWMAVVILMLITLTGLS